MLKKCIIKILFPFLTLGCYSQEYNFLFVKPEKHKINIESLQYKQVIKKANIMVYKPLKMVKITAKSGLNSNIVSKINIDTLKTGDFKDAFNDVEPIDFASIGKYDIRLKVYLTKRWRFLMRAQLVGFGKNFYSLGFYWKV